MKFGTKSEMLVAFTLGAILGAIITNRFEDAKVNSLTQHLASVEEQNLSLKSKSQRIASASSLKNKAALLNASFPSDIQPSTPRNFGIGSPILVSIKGLPAYPANTVAAAQLDADQMYGEILDRLNLSPETHSLVRKLLAERILVALDARREATKQGLNAASATELIRKTRAEVADQIMTEVDPATAATINRMLQNEDGLGRARGFSAMSPSPLTTNQLLSLAQVYTTTYAHNTTNVSNEDLTNLDTNTGLSIRDQQAVSQASKFLTPEQLTLLRTDLSARSARYKTVAAAQAAIMKSYHLNPNPK